MTKQKLIKLVLKGKPISTQHAYLQRGKIRFMTKQAKELKASYVEQIKEQYDGCILSDMGMVKIKLHFPDRRKRDWDNYHKLSMDALEGTVIENDNQLDCSGVMRYFASNDPRIEIELKF